MSRIKLFCFPYAGGTSAIFNKWKQYLDPQIEFRPIELSGRGKRIHEPLYKDLSEVIEDVFQIIKEEISRSQYALFGHSMGGMISYELAQKIRNTGNNQPLHIFFSGRSAPHVNREGDKKYHLMNDDLFKKEIMELGGTPPEFFKHPELLELFLPLLKNDFRIAETEIHAREVHPLDGNITVLVGEEDDLSGECDGWKKHTKRLCSIHYFKGGHFFLHNEAQPIVKLINNTLLKSICRV
jgi:surfactin synthase thioesterase subunit